MAFVSHFGRRGLATSQALNAKIQEVIVVGGGLMGAGVAQVAASTGHKVTLVDISQDVLEKSQARIGESIKRVSKKTFKDDAEAGAKFIDSSMSNLHIATSANEAMATADLVLEAVVENIGLKQKLFKEYDAIAPAKTIFASNTSSLPIAEIAKVTNRLDRFGGLHFFNPVPVMKLLELVRIPETSDDTFSAMKEWGKNLKKVTIDCKDTPGFVVNRLLVPNLMEAIRMLERGDATSKDIDTAMKLGAGHPMGPFELADYVGLDTIKFIMDGWSESYPEETLFQKSELLDKLVADGKFGRKSGEGFYKY